MNILCEKIISYLFKCSLHLKASLIKKVQQVVLYDFDYKHFVTKRVPLSSTPISVQHISSTRKGYSFSAPKILQFHTRNSSVQQTPQFNTKNLSFQNKEVCGTVECVEMRNLWCWNEGFWCWTEGFLMLKWGILGAEKVWSCVELICWIEWVCVELTLYLLFQSVREYMTGRF